MRSSTRSTAAIPRRPSAPSMGTTYAESANSRNVMGESRPRANENGPRTPITHHKTTGAVASMPTDPQPVTPSCPACGGAATQAAVRDLDAYTHEGTYVCAEEHIWTTRWFAAERSA